MENDGLYHIININMVVKPSIFVLESPRDDGDVKNRIVILSQQTGWSAKSFQQDNNAFEEGFMNCTFTNGKPDPYFILGLPDHCVRYVCNANGHPTSKPRKRMVLYRNRPFVLTLKITDNKV